ncbi:DUF4922 domain-containing protein [Bacteroidales bacterium OttesenSCG-928-M06]|nr:DUF4922 domain-containing protein [Bacteroidales bacterium OttesenSCG-928-M06]
MINIESFFQNQLSIWPSVSDNYRNLNQVEYKDINYNGFFIKIQYNPERIRSSVANLNRKVLEERPCFLCSRNRPQEQQQIDYPPHYAILINPYPIFPRHLTIPEKRHVPQLIKDRIITLLSLAENLPDYTILYNGPKSGASAPDHFHFQAANKGLLPLENDIHNYSHKLIIKKQEKGNIYQMQNYIRECFIFESPDKSWIQSEFEIFYQFLHSLQPDEPEPMFNIVCWKESEIWQLVVFPRKQHRPKQYYETGKNQILLSPGVVDFGGILVVPRKEDFDKLDKDVVENIYSQLTLKIDYR